MAIACDLPNFGSTSCHDPDEELECPNCRSPISLETKSSSIASAVGPVPLLRECASFTTCVALLLQNRGRVVVTDSHRRPLGILDPRLVLERLSHQRQSFAAIRATDLMRNPGKAVSESCSLETATRSFAEAAIDFLVVVDPMGCVVGILTAADVARLLPLAG